MHFDFLDTALCLRVVETLLHFLWQGFAIGLAMWVINAFVAQSNSNLRYRYNLFALLLMAACLPLTFALLPEHESTSPRTVETLPAMASNTSPLTEYEAVPVESVEPTLDPTPSASPQPLIVESSTNEASSLPVTPSPATDLEQTKFAGATTRYWMNRIAPYATVVYALGVMLMLLRLLLAVWGGQRLRRASQVIDEPGRLTNVRQLAHRLGLKVAPVVATCSRISVPVVVGILKPMILLPPSLVTGMSPAQLEAVLSHELAHLRRFDLLINLLQRLIEAMLFFHPAVWYVSRRVSLERENSCDDLVMEHGCDRLTYADALLRMAEICNDGSRQRGLASAAVLAATGNQPSEFKSRVLRVVGETSGPPLRLTRGGLTVLTLLLISLIALPWVMISPADGEKTLDGQSLEAQHPVLELSGRIADAKFIDTVAEQVARLPFATSWQLENAKQFARQIVQEHLPSDMPEEARRRILESLNEYVSRFIDRHQGETEDSAYCRRPSDVRNLLWRLKLALLRKPLDEQAQDKLDAQMAELYTWVHSVPLHPQSKLTHEAVISKLKQRQADAMEPLFKYPLAEEAFDEMMSKLRKKNSSSIFADYHAVADWFYAVGKASPDLMRLTDDPAEKTITRGTFNGHVRVGYQSTEVWLGNRNGTDAWSTFIDFSETVPGIRSLDPPSAVIEAGDDALREWVKSSASEFDNLGHITFDFKKRRLVGVRGTQLLRLDVDSYIAADRLNEEWLKQRIREKGLNEFSLPEPKSVDELGHDLTYDLFVGALTADNRLYVLKIETIGTLSRMMWYHVRLHNPPHPDEVKEPSHPDDHGSHHHDHSALTPEAQMKEVIGRFDPDYWKTVDVTKLNVDKQIAFSPDGEVLALMRSQTLYAIESFSGRYQKYQLSGKATLVEWKSGRIHVRTESGESYYYQIRRPRIQFLDRQNNPVSEECLVEARIGLGSPAGEWLMYSHKPGQPMSLMGLKPGLHWLVAGPSRDVFAASLPLRAPGLRLPLEAALKGEVTERKTPSGTVREITRQRQPQPRLSADNVFAKASVKQLSNGSEVLQIEIRNNSGERLQFSEQHIRLETELNGKYQEGLSPSWTLGNLDKKWKRNEIVIEHGSKRFMTLNWDHWCRRGLWYGGGSFHAFGPALGEAPPGKLQVRVHGPGFGTLPVALSIPEAEEASVEQREPSGEAGSKAETQFQSNGDQPQPLGATTLELYNQYIAKVGKIESASIAAAIELVASRAAGDPAFRELLRKDFATSRQEENQRYDSRKLLALITKVLYRDGGMRWQIEEEKRSGIPGQRALPQRGPLRQGDEVYRESALLADVIKYGRKCGRSEIDDFVFAVRQAHHPQGKQFLRDVLQNPSNPGDTTKGADIAEGNWPDNIGGGWQEARFLAAVGLAELGVEEGVRWLIEHARPNDFGEGGTIWHHTHFRSRTDGMRSNCELVLYDLTGVQNQGENRPTDWDKWWKENKELFAPRRVSLKE